MDNHNNNSEENIHGNSGAEHLASLLNRAEQIKYEYYCSGIDNAAKVSNKQVRAEAKMVRTRAQWLRNLSSHNGKEKGDPAALLSFKPKRKKPLIGDSGLTDLGNNEGNCEQSTFITWINHREYSMGSLASQSDVTLSSGGKSQRKIKGERRVRKPTTKDRGDYGKKDGTGSGGGNSKQEKQKKEVKQQVQFTDEDVVGVVARKAKAKSPGHKDTMAPHNNLDPDHMDVPSGVFLTESLPDIFKEDLPDSSSMLDQDAGPPDLTSPSSPALKLPAIVTQGVRTTHSNPAARLPKTPPKVNNGKSQRERIEEFLIEQQEFNKEFTNYEPEELGDDIFRSDLFLKLMGFSSRRCQPKRKLEQTKYTVYALRRLGISCPDWD